MWFSHWLRNAGMLLSWAATTFPLLTACVIDVFITHLLSPSWRCRRLANQRWGSGRGWFIDRKCVRTESRRKNCWLLSFDKSRRRSELWLLRPTAGKDAMEVNSRGVFSFEGAAELRGVASVWTGTQLGLWLPHQFTFNLQRLNFSRMASKPPSKLTPGHRTCTITENPQAKTCSKISGSSPNKSYLSFFQEGRDEYDRKYSSFPDALKVKMRGMARDMFYFGYE